MAIADTITSMQTHTSNAYTMIGYGTDLTGINKNLENLSSSIFNAFLEALRTPDTLFTNLPKKSGSGANITLNDTANAPMRIELGASELTQDGTPTPSSPQAVHTISGSNKVVVSNSDNTVSQEAEVDLGNIEYCKIGNYEDKFIRTSGKNKLDTSKFVSSTYIPSIDNNSSVIDINTNSSSNFITIFDNLDLPIGNYTIWAEVLSGTYTGGNLCYYDLSGTKYSSEFNFRTSTWHYHQFDATNGLNKLQIYAPSCTSNVKLKIWVVEGTYTSSTIPDYEPYGSNEWYIKKNIGKVVLDGNTILNYNGTAGMFYSANQTQIPNYKASTPLLSNYLQYSSTTWVKNCFGITSANVFWLYIENGPTSLADLQTWLSTHNLDIRYVLNTPTYTQITGTLETQLENVYQKLLSYTGTTNISQINNDLGFVMSVSAIEEL